MTDIDAQASTRVVFLVHEELADEVEQALRETGASDVERHRGERDDRILPFIPIVVAAVIGIGALAKLVTSIRSTGHCRTLIDARKEEIEQRIDCQIKDGRIIVIAKDGTKVQIIDAPDVFDLTEVLKAGISSTGDAVKSAAEAVGAITRGPEPATPED